MLSTPTGRLVVEKVAKPFVAITEASGVEEPFRKKLTVLLAEVGLTCAVRVTFLLKITLVGEA